MNVEADFLTFLFILPSLSPRSRVSSPAGGGTICYLSGASGGQSGIWVTGDIQNCLAEMLLMMEDGCERASQKSMTSPIANRPVSPQAHYPTLCSAVNGRPSSLRDDLPSRASMGAWGPRRSPSSQPQIDVPPFARAAFKAPHGPQTCNG